MSRRLWLILICAAILLHGLAPAHSQATPAPVVGFVSVSHIDLSATAALLDRMKELWSDGIKLMMPMPELDAFLVKADSKEALHRLQGLVKQLDRPQPQISVELTLVQCRNNDAFFITPDPYAEGNFSLRANFGDQRAGLTVLNVDGRSRVITTPKIVVPAYTGGVINIDQFPDLPLLKGVVVHRVLVAADNSLTLYLDPIFGAPGFRVRTIPLRVKDGDTMLMGSFVIKDDRIQFLASAVGDIPDNVRVEGGNTVNGNQNIFALFVTPTILQPDDDFPMLAPPLRPLF